MPENQEPTRGDEKSRNGLTGRRAYNLASDTVAGVNLPARHNAIQALAIFVCMVLGAGTGALLSEERVAGAIVGGVIGLIVGCFGRVLALMICRFIMHPRGKKD